MRSGGVQVVFRERSGGVQVDVDDARRLRAAAVVAAAVCEMGSSAPFVLNEGSAF